MGFSKNMKFAEKWLQAVLEKNSVLCAGLDPAESGMGRGKNGLPEGTDKATWSVEYIEAVAPYCAAVKPNIQYWKDNNDMETLSEISKIAHEQGMVVIDDSKLSDIGSTNDAGIYYTSKHNADAVTYAPFPMNIGEAAKQGQERNIGIIALCLMSNPEYETMKNAVVPLKDGTEMRMFEYVAMQCRDNKIDGIVIGAPSETNHIKSEEIETVRKYLADQLVLLPGVGAQGGEADIIWRYFGRDNVIVNVGRDMMFPGKSTYSEKAEIYQKMLNKLRAGAI